MGFSFDNNGNLKQSKMFLYSSKTKPIGILSGIYNIKLEQNFHKLFELNFKIYKSINNEDNEFYESVIKNKLIEVQGINWFQILSAVEKYDDNSKETYKEVKCCPLENMLIYRKVDDIVGVFGLYDVTDTSKSLLHIISAECGWSIGHVSNELLTKYRTFDINSMEIYNLLTTKISDSFGCVFQFDSYTKTINAYLLSELEEMTDIIISKKNILKEYIKDDSDNPIVTKMRVRGADDLDIRSVNFGRNYLVNLDYYMTNEWCSQGLVDAYNLYKTDYNNIRTSFNTSLATLKTKNAELTILKAQLKDLESLKSAQENVMGVSVQSHGRVPIPSDSDYTIYQNAVTLVNGYVAQIVTKKNQITSKQNEINSVQLTLDSISDSIDENNYFTPEQITEMNGFIVESDDYEDSTFVVTSETTEEEALEIKTELMQNAYEDLFIKSRPQYTFTIKATSLYTIQDDKDELIPYSEWISQFKIGSLITLNLGSSYMTVRLMTMVVDFDNPEEIDLVFSNKSRLDDELIQLAEIIADSGRTASSLSLKKMGYDAASKQTNQVREFMNGSLKATLNSFQTNDNQDMLFDEYGLHGRKWLPDQNKFDDRQSWFNNNGILITSDGWQSASTALGLITAPDGNSYYGIATDVLIGNLFIGEKLTLTGSGAGLDLSANSSITGLSAKITADINGLSATFTNYQNSANSTISTMQSSITQNATAITTKVSSTDYTGNTVISMINQSSTKIEQSALNIDLTGYVTFTNLSTVGQTTINGGNLVTGTVIADSVRATWVYAGTLTADQVNAVNIIADSVSADWVYAGNINASQINAGTISGDRIYGGIITGVTISGSTFTSVGTNGYTTTITNGSITTSYIVAGGTVLTGNSVTVQGGGSVLTISPTNISYFILDLFKTVTFLNSSNYSSYISIPTVPQYTNQLIASDTGHGNIDFQGFDNAAGVNWAQANFAPIGTSDIRLKYDIHSLDDIPDELFFSLKPKRFKYKTDIYGKGINFGLIAQEVESAFLSFGLNPSNYDIIEIKDVRAYTDDGLYVENETHRIHYNNLISWIIKIVQNQQEKIIQLENNIKL